MCWRRFRVWIYLVGGDDCCRSGCCCRIRWILLREIVLFEAFFAHFGVRRRWQCHQTQCTRVFICVRRFCVKSEIELVIIEWWAMYGRRPTLTWHAIRSRIPSSTFGDSKHIARVNRHYRVQSCAFWMRSHHRARSNSVSTCPTPRSSSASIYVRPERPATGISHHKSSIYACHWCCVSPSYDSPAHFCKKNNKYSFDICSNWFITRFFRTKNTYRDLKLSLQ